MNAAPRLQLPVDRIDTATAARMLGCSVRTVRRLAGAGRLEAWRSGKLWWFSASSVCSIVRHNAGRSGIDSPGSIAEAPALSCSR